MTQSLAMGSSTREAEASFAFPLKIRGPGLALIFRPCLCAMAKRLRDVCALPESELPECARPRAQHRGHASRNRIEQSAQQLGHCSGRGRPHSAVIHFRPPATPSPLPPAEAFPTQPGLESGVRFLPYQSQRDWIIQPSIDAQRLRRVSVPKQIPTSTGLHHHIAPDDATLSETSAKLA